MSYPDDSARPFLRQLLATLAYRAAKVLRDPPDGFATTSFGETTRTPALIVAHMADLMSWGVSLARGENTWKPEGSGDWDAEVRRFLANLQALDTALAADGPFTASVNALIQGPLADALTHVGQLAMLRHLAEAPIRGENYFVAEIAVGRVGADQAAARREFD